MPYSQEESSRGIFVVASDGEERVAVYVPADVTGEGVTVFWRGDVGKDHLAEILKTAEQGWRKDGSLHETIVFFGNERVMIGPRSQTVPGLSALVRSRPFKACRAELTSARGLMVLWANVENDEYVPLEKGGENIGLSFPPGLFEPAARAVVSFALQKTLPLPPNTMLTLLGQVSALVNQAVHRPV